MAPLRANQLKILLSDEELEWLKELAENKGLDVSTYVRSFIREQHEESGVLGAHLFAMEKKLRGLGALAAADRLRKKTAKLRPKKK